MKKLQLNLHERDVLFIDQNELASINVMEDQFRIVDSFDESTP